MRKITEEEMDLIFECAGQLAEKQVCLSERKMRQCPEEYPECVEILKKLDEAEQLMEQSMGQAAYDDCRCAFMAFASALATDSYLRGMEQGFAALTMAVAGEYPASRGE